MAHENDPAAARERRTLAEDLEVSRLGLGAMQLPGPGVWGPPADREEAVDVLRTAWDLGVTHIDTSDAYGPHVSNMLIHEALHPYPPDLVIATKVGVVRDESQAFVTADRPRQLRDQVESNLHVLGLDELDLVYLRVGGDGLLQPGPTPFIESFGTLSDMKSEGAIRHLGLSGVTEGQLTEAMSQAPVVAVQNRFHLFDRNSADVLHACERHEIAFVPYFPLAAGILKPDLNSSQLPPGMGLTDQQKHRLDSIANRHQASRTQVAIAWLLHLSLSILAIPGTSSVAHVEENVDATRIPLSTEEVQELTRIG